MTNTSAYGSTQTTYTAMRDVMNNASSLGHNEKLLILSQLDTNWFDRTTETILIVVFSIMILFGALGNGLVCFVVMRNAHMRTPRNIFIINLAISDLTLCLFTQPLNLYRLLNMQWHLGALMCKFSAMLQGTNVFVSTISITAIALDRFQVIVYPSKDSMKKIGGAAALITIWIISFLMSSPLLIFTVFKEAKPLQEIEFYQRRCLEDVTLRAEKGAYSVASMVVQYILPIITVSIAHARICNKLKYRMVNRRSRRSDDNSPSNHHQRPRHTDSRAGRKRRTNILLAMIAIVFVLSWMPLNIINILVEFQFQLFGNVDINLVFVICHMLVLSSACTNPVLYGWLNENFRKEFRKVLSCGCWQLCTSKTCFRKFPNQSIPVIVFSPDRHGGHSNGCNGRPTNFSQITTDIEQSQTVVSL